MIKESEWEGRKWLSMIPMMNGQNASNSQIKCFKLTLWKVHLCVQHKHAHTHTYTCMKMNTFRSLWHSSLSPSLPFSGRILFHSWTLFSTHSHVQLYCKMLLLFCFIISPFKYLLMNFTEYNVNLLWSAERIFIVCNMLKYFFHPHAASTRERKKVKFEPFSLCI